MKYLVAILFLLTGFITEAQQRIVIENLAAVDSAWISGGNLFYRKNGNTFNAGSVGGAAPVTSVFGRTGAITAQIGDYSLFYFRLTDTSAKTWDWTTKITGKPTFVTTESDPLSFKLTDTSSKNWDWSRITAKPNLVTVGDTGAMLLPYLRKIDTTGKYIGIGWLSTLAGKQDLLVSGTNIKTVNGNSLLGSGNLSISGLTADSSTSINNRILARFPSDTSLSMGNRFLSVDNNLTFINQRLDSVKAVEIDKTLDSLAWVKSTGELKIKSARVTAGSSKVSVTGSGTDSTRQWAVDVNEANLTINNIGGTLQTSKGGVPTGGSTGQVLKKNSNSDYDYSWQADNTGGAGSSLTTQSVTGTGAVGDSIRLVNDVAAPGNNQVYGTNSSGTRTWRAADVVTRTSSAEWDIAAWNNTTSAWNNRTTDSLFKRNYQYRRQVAFDFHSDFISGIGGDLTATNSTGSTGVQATDATNRVGLVRTTTAASATGRSYINTAASAVRLGGGEWKYEIMLNPATLSTGTERYQLLAGFFDTYTAANQVDGVYFLYDEGGVSTGSTAAAYWQTVTASNSVRTFNTSLTQTTVNAATWVRLTIIVNADATRAEFFINGTNVAVHTGNIPSGSGRELGFGWGLIKSAGTTARTVDIDYLTTQLTFTTIRQ